MKICFKTDPGHIGLLQVMPGTSENQFKATATVWHLMRLRPHQRSRSGASHRKTPPRWLCPSLIVVSFSYVRRRTAHTIRDRRPRSRTS